MNVNETIRVAEVNNKVRVRTELALFLQKAFGFSLIMTFGAIFCQGFSLWGFHLGETFLNWLGVATIGQVAVLLAIILRQK